ncbi:MAG TPA: diaminopimelate decarboxylase [Stellaceae bacterium]|nr:diaminopimelate decarboxylase [Stellaceae bacterium]
MIAPILHPETPEIAYRGGDLSIEDVTLARMAAAVGTPFYAYSAGAIERQYRRFAAAFAGRPARLCYSVKANSNLSVIATLAALGAGADVVSEGEFRRALAAGIPGNRIVFSGVGKSEAELEFAVAHDVYQINVESRGELEALSAVAQRAGRTVAVAIRVNPDVDARTHHKIATGKKENKFGIDLAHAPEVFAEAALLRGIALKGLAVHIGSQLTALGPFEIAFSRVAELYRALAGGGIRLERLDFGGGIGIRYRDETPPTIEEYAGVIRQMTRGLDVELAFEPGRYIVGNAGVLATHVLYVKEGVTRRFIIVDAAMNDLVRPTLYDAWHEIVPARAPEGAGHAAAQSVVGPVCETGDAFALDRPLPPFRPGDLMAILSAGAYGAVMSSSYNTRPPAAEVLVRGGDFAVIRERPSYDELLARDRMAPWLTGR